MEKLIDKVFCHTWHVLQVGMKDKILGSFEDKMGNILNYFIRYDNQRPERVCLVIHHNTSDHNFDLINVNLIKREKDWLSRKCIESAIMLQFLTINQRPGSYIIFLIITKAMITQCSIQDNREWRKKRRWKWTTLKSNRH